MLSRVGGLLGEIGLIIRSCHERWDGAGYPDGLAGEQIPLIARIVSCCDAYNAITTDRPATGMRRRTSTRWTSCAGTPARSSDPEVVAAVLRVVGRRQHA